MKRIFIKNLLLLQLLNLIIKPLWLLLIDRMAQNMLGQEVYGEYYMVLNLTLILNIFLDLGIQNFNNTSIAADKGFFRRNFRNIFLIKAVLSALYLLLLLFIGWRTANDNTPLLLLLAGIQILNTFILYLRTNINGLHLYTTDSLLSVSDKFFASIICIVLYFSSAISILNFVLAQLAASCITFGIAFGINIREWKRIESSSRERDKLQLLLKQSLPYALLFTLMNFYTRMDVAMMNWLLPDAAFHSGIYAQSFRLLDAAAMFAMLFAGLLLPMFARMLSNHEDVRPLAGLATSILLFIALTTALAAWLYAEPIFRALYTFGDIEHLLLSASVFRNIMLSFVPMSITFVFSTLLTAKKDIWHMNLFALAAFVCNFSVNYFLIPAQASYGASWGTLITQTVFALLCLHRCFRLFDFGFPLRRAMAYVMLCVMLAGLHFFTSALGHVWLELLLFGSGSLLFSFLLRIFRPADILGFLKQRGQ